MSRAAASVDGGWRDAHRFTLDHETAALRRDAEFDRLPARVRATAGTPGE